MSVFISYSTKDERYAQRIEKAFLLNKIPYWFAPKDIKAGESFADIIATELSNHKAKDVYDRINEDYEHLMSSSTELFLLILSDNSMSSKWVKKELISAIDEEIPVLVLHVDNAPIISGFKYLLKDIQIVKSYHLDKQGIEEIVNEVRKKVHLEEVIEEVSDVDRLTYQDIGIYPIAEGDPFFIEGQTLITKLSDKYFFLAPPLEEYLNPKNAEYFEHHSFQKEDVVFDCTLETICLDISIPQFRQMLENSRRKIFRQFLRQENGCYYNNRKYGIYNFSFYERTEDIAEDPIARLEFYTTDYFTHRVMKDVCKQLVKLRGSYFRELNYNKIGNARIFFTSLGINLLLSDKSGNVLLTGRSTNAAETYNKHSYSVSVIEGVSQSDYDYYEKKVNLQLAILRGIKEELGVDEHYLLKDSLKMYDVFINSYNQEWGISCSLELQQNYDLKKNIIPLRGKDETLEVSDKKVIENIDLRAFLINNRTRMLPQAVYTICVFLEANGVSIIDRYRKSIFKNTAYIMGKDGTTDSCGDAYVWGENYIAVIDGATPKGNILWEGQKGDVFVSHLLSDAIEKMDANLSGVEAMIYLNNIVKKQYDKFGIDFISLNPEERLQCSVLIYSATKNEIWSFGDCLLKINENEFYNIKEGDKLFAALRAFCIQVEKDRLGTSIDGYELSKYGRECILSYLKQYVTLANRNVPFGYDVIDGGNINAEHVKIYGVQKNDNIVMATDGYPRLFDSIEETEEYLRKVLEQDPMCINILQRTKGVAEGNDSFDDRTYISFKVV